jgi:apolipoprotein N-acyltransferase
LISSQAEAARSRVQNWMVKLTPWRRRGFAFLAGAIATLGHAPFQIAPAFVLSIVALVWLLDAAATRPKQRWAAFGAGWWYGFGHFTTGLYWISSAFMVDSEAWGPIWGVPAVVALAGGLAIFWGAGCALAMSLWTTDVRRLAAFAAAITITEWLRGNILTGFPWLLPGYIWTPGEPISQIASVFGIYGLTAITLLVSAAPAAIADGQVNTGRRFAPLIAASLLVGLLWGWGTQRLAGAPVEPPGAAPIVRVTDSGLSQAEKWRSRPDQEWRVLELYLEASGPPDESDAAIVIWPEGAIPVVNFYALENQQFLDAIGAGLGDRVLVTGLVRRELRGNEIVHFNSAAVIDGVSGAARLSQIYDKHHLVPFGEYIPFWNLVSRLKIAPLQRIGAAFQSGPRPTRLIVPEAPPAIVLICYEAIFPGLIPQGEERPGWIISVTNDSWFGNGTGPWQHYVMARYRALESGLPLARSASGGISAIVDSYGRAVRSTYRRGGFAEAQLPPSIDETPHARWGALLFALLLVIIATLRFLPPGALGRGLKS